MMAHEESSEFVYVSPAFSPARILNCLDPDPYSQRIQFGSGSTTLVLGLCMRIPLPLQ